MVERPSLVYWKTSIDKLQDPLKAADAQSMAHEGLKYGGSDVAAVIQLRCTSGNESETVQLSMPAMMLFPGVNTV